MEIKTTFNNILLAISLATILLTLVSFIVFKIKYSFRRSRRQQVNPLDGAFFKRYAPHLETKNLEKVRLLEEKENQTVRSPRLIAYVFVAFALLIFVLLAGQHYFSYQAELDQKINEAERIKSLLKKGLLQEFDFDPSYSQTKKEEFIPPLIMQNAKSITGMIAQQKITIIATDGNKRLNNYKANTAVERWLSFCKRNQLSCDVTSKLLQEFKADVIYVLPQQKFMGEQQRTHLTKMIDDGHHVIMTGPVAIGDLQGKFKNKNLLYEKYDIKLEVNSAAKSFYPTLTAAWQSVPAGVINRWIPVDNDYVAADQMRSIDLFQSNKLGLPVASSNLHFPARAVHLKNNALWLLLDPIEKVKGAELFYADLMITKQLLQLLSMTVPEIAPWRDGKVVAPMAIAIDTEESFAKLEVYAKILDRQQQRATFYLVATEVEKNREIINKYAHQHEWATHTYSHQQLSNLPAAKIFDDIQQSRMVIEEALGKKVVGIRPPYEVIDSQTLAMIAQNRLQYIFGDQEFIRFQPIMVAEGELLYFPRILSDDVIISRNRLLSTPEEVAEYLMQNYLLCKKLGGAYFLALHTQTFTTPFYQKALEIFLQQFSSKEGQTMTFGEMNEWHRLKSSIASTYKREGKRLTITYTNTGERDIANFDILLPNDGTEFSCEQMETLNNNDQRALHVEKLSKGESLSLACQSK